MSACIIIKWKAPLEFSETRVSNTICRYLQRISFVIEPRARIVATSPPVVAARSWRCLPLSPAPPLSCFRRAVYTPQSAVVCTRSEFVSSRSGSGETTPKVFQKVSREPGELVPATLIVIHEEPEQRDGDDTPPRGTVGRRRAGTLSPPAVAAFTPDGFKDNERDSSSSSPLASSRGIDRASSGISSSDRTVSIRD